MPIPISVITATFNSAKTLPDTLRGLECQHYPALEYIIVDGGSTDGTLELARNNPLVTKWVSEKDNGVYDAQSKGLRMATGDLIGVINSDDYYLDGALERVAQAAAQRPDVDIFYGDQLYEKENGDVITNIQQDPIGEKDFWRMPINTATVFARRACYEQHGYFDTRYQISADCDLFLRFIKAGCRFAKVPGAPLAHTRAGGLSDRKYGLAHVERVKILLRQRAAPSATLRAINRLARYPLMSLRTGRAFRKK